MSRKLYVGIGVVVLVLLVGVVYVVQASMAKTGVSGGTSDPQRLMIPRWFLTSLKVDGSEVNLGENQLTLQFEEGGKANGTGGCNSFATIYQATPDGKMSFGPIMSTEMACDALQLETAYLQSLAKVAKFNTENYKLTLSSADGKTVLIYSMPPK